MASSTASVGEMVDRVRCADPVLTLGRAAVVLAGEGVLQTDEGAEAIRALFPGVDWSQKVDRNTLLEQIPGLISRHRNEPPTFDVFDILLTCVTQPGNLHDQMKSSRGQRTLEVVGLKLLEAALSAGASWQKATPDHCMFQTSYQCGRLLEALESSALLDHPLALSLLDSAIAADAPDIMMERFEGGGTFFSCLIDAAFKTGVAVADGGPSGGGPLMDLGLKHGGDWSMEDGWQQSSFQELVCACFFRKYVPTRYPNHMTVESSFPVMEAVLTTMPEAESELGWNRAQDRSMDSYKNTVFYDFLHNIAEEGHLLHPMVPRYINLAEKTGAKWDKIAWNRWPFWSVSKKGRLTDLWSLVDSIGHAGHSFEEPAVIDLLARAVSSGADYLVDAKRDSDDCSKRISADVENVILAPRRNLLRICSLLRQQRATRKVIEAEDSAICELQMTAKAIEWIAEDSNNWALGKVLAFLPGIPPILGYVMETREGKWGPRRRDEPINFTAAPNRR